MIAILKFFTYAHISFRVFDSFIRNVSHGMTTACGPMGECFWAASPKNPLIGQNTQPISIGLPRPATRQSCAFVW